MSNRWICNVAMLVPIGIRSNAALIASSLSGNKHDNSPEFFSRAVRPIGEIASTHYLSHSRMRESVLAKLAGIKNSLVGAEYHVTSHDDDDDNVTREDVYTWLFSMGLEMIEELY